MAPAFGILSRTELGHELLELFAEAGRMGSQDGFAARAAAAIAAMEQADREHLERWNAEMREARA